MIFFILPRLLLVIPTLIGAMAIAAKAQASAESFQWAKVCDTDGSCWIVHQRLDGNTGSVLVGAAVRLLPTSKGARLHLVVGVESSPRADVTVLSRSTWIAFKEGNLVADDVPRLDVPLSCSDRICKGVLDVTPAMLNVIASGGGLIVRHFGFGRVGVPIPLAGFVAAVAGAPCDHHCFNFDRVLNHFRAMN